MHILFAKQKLFHSRSGSAIVFFAIAMAVMAGICALALDIGVVALERAELSSAIDAAALAGAQELVANETNTGAEVESYAKKNAGVLKSLIVNVTPNYKLVEVTGVKTVNYYFAEIFGFEQQDIIVSAKAKVETIKSLTGVRPLAVINQTFNYGQSYTLKEGAGGGTSGNYAAMDLGGSGASGYGEFLRNGYPGTLSVGDQILTETGNITQTTLTSIDGLIHSCTHSPACTYTSYNKNCPRIIFVPVVNTLEVSGKKYVQILGFGTFFLEGVTSSNGQADVIGRFITYHANGETAGNINDYGTYNIRLVR